VAVWRDALRDSPLDSTAKLVGLVLSTYFNARGSAYPGRAALARGASVCDRTIDHALRRLEATGFLHVERTNGGNNRTNGYQALLPEAASEQRQSEWQTANLATPTANLAAPNGELRSPESAESVESPTSTPIGRVLVEHCVICGEEFKTSIEEAACCSKCEGRAVPGRRRGESQR
jgi:hypothetical protein